ncbi:MAG: carboxypeptidase regulatory-like domain-containing protein [Bacteroidales bacterium]|nr:carboxypeptidase regulatory-like domain-containing protein [Bacteroidales bacterium]
MKTSLTLFIALIMIQAATAQFEDKAVLRIKNPSEQAVKRFYSQGYDVASYQPKSHIDIVGDFYLFSQLKNEGLDVIVTVTEQELRDHMLTGAELNGYRSYADLLTELQQIEAAHPSICKLYDVGDSRGKEYLLGGNNNYANYNHEVWALKVSDNVQQEEDEPCIYYMGEHHAREPISLEVAMYILNHILNNYGTDPQITANVNSSQIWFIPLVNPNGHKIVTDEWDLWWRKNIRDNNGNGNIDPSSGSSYPDGVDPNRNYGFEWGGQGTSTNPGDITYCGPSGFSEPEVYAMRDLLSAHHFVAGISYHSYSELVLWPYGYTSGATPPDQAALSALGIAMANTIPAAGGGYYTPQQSWQLYPASGTTDDYAYGEHGIFGYTIELGTEFIPPANEILSICQDNLQAALILQDRINKSTLTGHVFNASTSQPVVAEVYVEGIDNSGVFREPYRSDTAFGRYYRMLPNGNYTVTFSAYGYISQTFTGVNINSVNQTILDVYLVPAQVLSVSGTVTDLSTGLPIENATVEVLDAPLPPFTTNQNGQYVIPQIFEGIHPFKVYALNYATIIQNVNVTPQSTVFDFQLEESLAWSFELGVFEPQWSTGGNAPWFITTENPYDGAYCVRSGNIGHNQSSTLSITLDLTSAGTITFYRKVSSEAGYDFLRFYIDGVQQDEWSGELGWGEASFPVPSGTHEFRWAYVKDAYVVGGSDRAWIDYITFPPYNTDPVIQVQSVTIDDTGTGNGNGMLDPGETADIIFDLINNGMGPASQTVSTLTSACAFMNILSPPVMLGNINPYTTAQAPFTISIDPSIPTGTVIDLVLLFESLEATSTCTVYEAIGTLTAHEDFETGDFSKFPWGFSGNQNWTITTTSPYQGVYCARSGAIGHNQSSALEITLDVVSDGTISFYRKVSSETNYDYLRFLIDGQEKEKWSGNVSWGYESYAVTKGTHTFKWNYTKDQNTISGSDCGWVDMITFPPVVSLESIQVTVYLEGPYNGSEMDTWLNTAGFLPASQPYSGQPWYYPGTIALQGAPPADVVDWVLVELRETSGGASTANSSAMIGKIAGLLLKDGSIVSTDGSPVLTFPGSITDNLYAVIRHRNHLSVMSSGPLQKVNGTYTWDFTSAVGQAYGGNLAHTHLGNGAYGMTSGDGNANGQVETGDKVDVWAIQAGQSGYLPGDYDMDANVTNGDKIDLWAPNSGKGTQVPM